MIGRHEVDGVPGREHRHAQPLDRVQKQVGGTGQAYARAGKNRRSLGASQPSQNLGRDGLDLARSKSSRSSIGSHAGSEFSSTVAD